MTQAYYPGDVTVPAAGLKEAKEHYEQLQLGPNVPSVIWEQRGSVRSSAFHAAPSDSNAQPRFQQRWEAYIFFGCADKADAEAMREAGRGMKEVLLRHAQAGGRIHLTQDEPSRIEYYYGPNSQRVREAVAKYDPHRLFASCNGMEF